MCQLNDDWVVQGDIAGGTSATPTSQSG